MRILIHITLIFISLMMYNNAPKRMDTAFMIQCFFVAFMSIFLYFSLKKGKKIILSHSLLFTIAFSIVFYQFDIDYTVGLVDMTLGTNKITVFNERVVCKALCIANVALNCLYAGLCLRERYKYISTNKIYYFKNYNKNLNLICISLLIAYLLSVNKEYLIGGYAKHIEQGFIANFCMSLLQATIISFFILRCYEIRRDNINIISLKVFFARFKSPLFYGLIVTTLILMSGRRTEAISVLLSMFFGFVYVYRGKIPIIKLTFVILALATLFSFISFFRVEKYGNAQEAMQAVSEISSIFPPTRELAFNVSSLHIVLTYVPSLYNYNYGITFFPGFLTIIPGAHGLFFKLVDLPILEQGSAFFVTMMGNRDLSWGLGTSCVADVYLSFGLIGVMIIFFIFGVYLGYLEKISVAKLVSPFLLVLALCTFKELIYMSRGSLARCFNCYTYSILLIYLNVKSYKLIK